MTLVEQPWGKGTLNELRENLRSHLDRLGEALERNNGSIRHRFSFDCVRIDSVLRFDLDDDVSLIESGGHERLPYKVWLPQAKIEERIVAYVRKKVLLAKGYDFRWPLWLSIWNPNDVFLGMSAQASVEVEAINSGTYCRITVFHHPFDVVDARPLQPRFVDLLPARDLIERGCHRDDD